MTNKRGFVIAALVFFLTAGSLTGSWAVNETAVKLPQATKLQLQVKATKQMLKNIKTLRSYSLKDYDREAQFGDSWLDVEGNGCDTRNDMLKRDLTREVFNDSCEIATGRLKDPYTNKTINFVRGVSTSIKVQIDHVIPLSLAWKSGAHSWSLGKRVAFSNDPLNLMAVDGPTNGSKSDSGPDEWLPPISSYHCTYVMRFTRVAHQYGLALTAASKSVITQKLNSCTRVVGRPATMTPLSPALWSRAADLAR